MTVHARVKNGRLLVDEPTDLPDGTELVLVPAGEQQPWDLTPEELAELKERLAQGRRSGPCGRGSRAAAGDCVTWAAA